MRLGHWLSTASGSGICSLVRVRVGVAGGGVFGVRLGGGGEEWEGAGGLGVGGGGGGGLVTAGKGRVGMGSIAMRKDVIADVSHLPPLTPSSSPPHPTQFPTHPSPLPPAHTLTHHHPPSHLSPPLTPSALEMPLGVLLHTPCEETSSAGGVTL